MTTLENGADCDYDVVVDLPTGFTDKPRRSNEGEVADFTLTPARKFDGIDHRPSS